MTGTSGLLSMVGYLEESISKSIMEALVISGGKRLKHPALTVSDTSKLFFALYLKSTNVSQPDHLRAKYTIKLQQFERECKLALYISSAVPRGAGSRASKALGSKGGS
jgi:hypothetical protein